LRARKHFLHALLVQQAHLAVPVARMGIAFNAVILAKNSL